MKFNNLFRSKNGKRPLFVRIIAMVIVVLLILALLITMLPAIAFGEGLPLVVDEADILTDQEEKELEDGLQAFRQEQNFDIVVLTVNSLEGEYVVDYADNYYDDNDYGGGSNKDGALILVSMEDREWTIITSGYGTTAITDYALDMIDEEILPDLRDGNYSKAFRTFGDRCAYCVRQARDGNIIDEYIPDEPEDEDPNMVNPESQGGSSEKKRPSVAMNAGLAGAIGALYSWLINGRKKAQLKSVRRRTQAKEYMRTGSLQLTENRDRYLYNTVSRVPISRDDEEKKPNGHWRGSTVHRSPRGKIHGGGRTGKF